MILSYFKNVLFDETIIMLVILSHSFFNRIMVGIRFSLNFDCFLNDIMIGVGCVDFVFDFSVFVCHNILYVML
jgi:hypothetical protein